MKRKLHCIAVAEWDGIAAKKNAKQNEIFISLPSTVLRYRNWGKNGSRNKKVQHKKREEGEEL